MMVESPPGLVGGRVLRVHLAMMSKCHHELDVTALRADLATRPDLVKSLYDYDSRATRVAPDVPPSLRFPSLRSCEPTDWLKLV